MRGRNFRDASPVSRVVASEPRRVCASTHGNHSSHRMTNSPNQVSVDVRTCRFQNLSVSEPIESLKKTREGIGTFNP